MPARNKLDADMSMPPAGIQTRVPRTLILKSGSQYDQLVYVPQEIMWKDINQILK
jgi:hypothetical protein